MSAVDLLASARRLGAPGSPRVLFLHGMDGLLFSEPFLSELARECEVIAPEHPGWGAEGRPAHLRTVDDLAYPYLDLIDSLTSGGDEPLHLVGVSLGAWLAAEIATKSCVGIGSIVLGAPVGVRTGEPTLRRYLDLYASPSETVLAALYGDPQQAPDLRELTDAQFEQLARAQEATAYVGWEPYLHTAGLVERLHRITRPTLLVRGESDGLVLDHHAMTTFAERLPAASSTVLPVNGHRIEELAPAELAAAVIDFVRRVG